MDQEAHVERGHRTFFACVAAVAVAEVALATACTAVLGDWTLLLNQNVLSSHMPQTGMTCGRPSGQTLASQ